MSFFSWLFEETPRRRDPPPDKRILKALFAAVEEGKWTKGFDKRTYFVVHLEGKDHTIDYGFSIKGNVRSPEADGIDRDLVPIISKQDALKLVARIRAIHDAKYAKIEATRKQKEIDLMRKLYP